MQALAVAVPVAGVESVAPDCRLAGLSLLLRTVLTLQKHGATVIFVVAAPEEAGVGDRIRADARVRAEIEEISTEDLAKLDDEQLLIARYDRVADDAVYAQLMAADVEGQTAAIAVRDGEPLGMAWAPGTWLSNVGLDPSGWRQGAQTRVDVGDRFAIDVTTAAGRAEAKRALFDACRKPTDGIVSRHLNRHISLFISRLVVDTPITPNAMTALTFVVAIAAGYFAVDGSYERTLVAGLLIQLNSILDGCDGELARIRFQGSKLGQWLDTLGDDVSNVLFWSTLAVGASRSGVAAAQWLALAGWVAAGANALAALLNYSLLVRSGSGDLYSLPREKRGTPGIIGKVVGFFSTILSQDFFLFVVMCTAIIGILHYWLPVMALGATITAGNALVRTVRMRRARGR